METHNEHHQTVGEVTPPPRPEISYGGHLQSFGGEMLTYAKEGALMGALIGFVVGFALYLALSTGLVLIPTLDVIQQNNSVLFFMIIIFLSTLMGTFGGTVVGIGTPKINPHPEQGWVREWKTFFLRFRGKPQQIYVPILKKGTRRYHDKPAQ